MTRDLKVLRDPWGTWIINRFYKSFEWLESSIGRDLDMRFAHHSWFCSLQTLFLLWDQVIKKNILLLIVIRENETFISVNLYFFRSWTVWERPSLYTVTLVQHHVPRWCIGPPDRNGNWDTEQVASSSPKPLPGILLYGPLKFRAPLEFHPKHIVDP